MQPRKAKAVSETAEFKRTFVPPQAREGTADAIPRNHIQRGLQGVVKMWSKSNGVGYIIPADGGNDVLFDALALLIDPLPNPLRGVTVSFDRYSSDKGQRALNVRLFHSACCPTCGRPMDSGK